MRYTFILDEIVDAKLSLFNSLLNCSTIDFGVNTTTSNLSFELNRHCADTNPVKVFHYQLCEQQQVLFVVYLS